MPIQRETSAFAFTLDPMGGFTVVWERIVDEENLDCVMEVRFSEAQRAFLPSLPSAHLPCPQQTFNNKDTQKIRKRIGTLNTFNPFAADGPYELDFGIPEDRLLASILIRLDETEAPPLSRSLFFLPLPVTLLLIGGWREHPRAALH